jgi:hypothetical protein
MKRTFLLIAFSVVTIIAFAQDSTAKKDTVYKDKVVPVYVFEVTDTVQVPTLLYQGEKNMVKYSAPGYYIRKGQAVKTEKGAQYVKEPAIIGALDDKKRPVKPI